MTSSYGVRAAALLGLSLVLSLLAPESSPGTRIDPTIPDPFYGVVLQQETIGSGDVRRLEHGRVGTVRFAVSWPRIERHAGEYDFSSLDAQLTAIREAGAVPLPFVFGTPARFDEGWHSPIATPEGAAAWDRFLRALVGRYGPGGELDRSDPLFEPVRTWQIWNEPNLPGFWGPGPPDPAAYADLLRASALAIHDLDPAAAIVAAGLAPARKSVHAPDFITGVYRSYAELGVPPDFDQASIHPYANSVRESVERVEAFRAAVDRGAGGVATPILVGEIGWGSGSTPPPFLNGSPASQARHVSKIYRKLGERRRELELSGVLWFAWRDRPADGRGCGFCSIVGLFDFAGEAKPAWKTFRRLQRRGLDRPRRWVPGS